jgi:hypothetical protein
MLLAPLVCTHTDGIQYLAAQTPGISTAMTTLGRPGHVASPTSRLAPLAALRHQRQQSMARVTRASAESKETYADDFAEEEIGDRAFRQTAVKGEDDFFTAFKKFDVNGMGREFNKAVDYFAVGGRREKRWRKDFRPEELRGVAAGPSATSQLSWGGAKTLAMYDEMAEQFEEARAKRAALRLENQPLGSAATAVLGESGKADADLDSELADACAIAEVPTGDECEIGTPVELAELIRGKYGRYFDIDVKKSRDALNEGVIILYVYAVYLGYRSFPYTEEQWLQKLNNIVILLNDLEQGWYVKKFLLSKAQASSTILGPRMSKPTSDKALTFRLSESPTWEEPRNSDIYDSWLMLQGIYPG